MQGRPNAMASSTAMPSGSYTEGMTNAVARSYSSAIRRSPAGSARETRPSGWTPGASIDRDVGPATSSSASGNSLRRRVKARSTVGPPLRSHCLPTNRKRAGEPGRSGGSSGAATFAPTPTMTTLSGACSKSAMNDSRSRSLMQKIRSVAS
jgi:hypothetical protein